MSFEWKKIQEDWSRLDLDAVLVFYLSHISNPKTQSFAFSILDEEEKKKALAFHFEKDRMRFANVRAALKILLKKFASFKNKEISITYSEYSKPMLLGENRPCFNVSHSSDSALLAFSLDTDLGIDLEWITADRKIESIAQKHFSEEECDYIFAAQDLVRTQRFFQLWTAKEAFLKAKGKGLWADLTEARFPLREFTDKQKAESEGYQLLSLDLPDPHFKGALCVKGEPKLIEVYETSLEEVFRANDSFDKSRKSF